MSANIWKYISASELKKKKKGNCEFISWNCDTLFYNVISQIVAEVICVS